jgi:NAD(P)-dependent dehydrogenase (short-subunit alcohol dehydrogenase family)
MRMRSDRFKTRIAVVTGSARGIGLSIARRLLEDGAKVAIVDIDAGALAEATKNLKTAGLTAFGHFQCDIADRSSVETLGAAVQAQIGCVDILINNAAILDSTPIDTLTGSTLEGVWRVNFSGAVNCIQTFLPQLAQSRAARIVNVASINGLRGTSSSVAYNSAKAALINLTRCLAVELSPRGILVNAVAPGFIETRMSKLPDGTSEYDTEWFRDVFIKHRRIPLGRVGRAEDVAGPVAFLCSDDAQYIAGQVLIVDGGVTATF